MLQDLRYAPRSLRRHRGVTAIAVICMALGIGVNAMTFSTVDGVLLQPFPFADPERIAGVRSRSRDAGVNRSTLSYPDLLDLRRRARTLDAVARVTFRSLAVSDGRAEPERVAGGLITSDPDDHETPFLLVLALYELKTIEKDASANALFDARARRYVERGGPRQALVARRLK